MNERIKQFWNHAASLHSGDSWAEQTAFLEKFAELIVRECARTAAATACPYHDEQMKTQLGHTWDMACVAAARDIREQFGVK